MSSEIDLYRGNVPHGDGNFEYVDWSTTFATVTITAGTSKEIYVNTINFIAANAMAFSAGSFTLAGGGFSHTVNSVMELYGIADPFTLKVETLEGSNNYVVGEIKLNPPVVVDSGNSFTITASTSPAFAKTGAFHLITKYWEDVPATS